LQRKNSNKLLHYKNHKKNLKYYFIINAMELPVAAADDDSNT